jgi:tetratricopeptide (TPR) repeat protein
MQEFRKGRYHAAIDIADVVLKEDRKNPDALNIIGKANFNLRRLQEAARAFDAFLRLQPENIQVRLLLGQIQLQRGKYGPALVQYDRILKHDPGNIDAVQGKAVVYNRQKKDDKLEACLRPFLDAPVPDDRIVYAYAQMLERNKRYDEALTWLDRPYGTTAPPETIHARNLILLKGRILEKLERYADAFAAFETGQQLLVNEYPYNPDHYSSGIDQLIDAFSNATLERIPVATTDIDLPVFIVGMPRTGSTLVERIIAAHPAAFGGDELPFLYEVLHDMGMVIASSHAYPQCVTDLKLHHVNDLGRNYARRLQTLQPKARRITDKMLNNYEHIGILSRILPRARIIHVQRNPLDSCLSMYSLAMTPQVHRYLGRLEWIGRRYRDYQRLMRHWTTVLPDAVLTVQYEDLVADQETWSRRIIEHVGLPWDDRCLAFHAQQAEALTFSREQVTQPIYRTSVNRAEHFGSLLDPLRKVLERA